MHVFIHPSIHTHTNINIFLCIYNYKSTCTAQGSHSRWNVFCLTSEHLYTYTCIYIIYVYVCMYIYLYIFVCTSMYTYIYTCTAHGSQSRWNVFCLTSDRLPFKCSLVVMPVDTIARNEFSYVNIGTQSLTLAHAQTILGLTLTLTPFQVRLGRHAC